MNKMDETGYRALLSELAAMAPGAYVTDECIDRENVLVDGRTESSDDFWTAMAYAAKAAAEMRLEEIRA